MYAKQKQLPYSPSAALANTENEMRKLVETFFDDHGGSDLNEKLGDVLTEFIGSQASVATPTHLSNTTYGITSIMVFFTRAIELHKSITYLKDLTATN